MKTIWEFPTWELGTEHNWGLGIGEFVYTLKNAQRRTTKFLFSRIYFSNSSEFRIRFSLNGYCKIYMHIASECFTFAYTALLGCKYTVFLWVWVLGERDCFRRSNANHGTVFRVFILKYEEWECVENVPEQNEYATYDTLETEATRD